jgi:hypothetical protein
MVALLFSLQEEGGGGIVGDACSEKDEASLTRQWWRKTEGEKVNGKE